MSTEEDLTLIDSFIQGSLSHEEREAVKARMAQDPEFLELHDFALSLKAAARRLEGERIKAMLQAADLEEAPDQADEATERGVIPISGRTGEADRSLVKRRSDSWPFASMGIAASVAVALLVWQPTRSSNEELFANYAASTVDAAASPAVTPLPSSADSGVRGTESYMEGFTAAEMEQVTRALYSIQAKDFDNANAQLKQLIQVKGEQPVLLLNLAIAQLNSHEVEPAIEILEKLISQPQLPFKADVEYALALGYIKTGKLTQARELLTALRDTSPKYANAAEAILGKLRWWF